MSDALRWVLGSVGILIAGWLLYQLWQDWREARRIARDYETMCARVNAELLAALKRMTEERTKKCDG